MTEFVSFIQTAGFIGSGSTPTAPLLQVAHVDPDTPNQIELDYGSLLLASSVPANGDFAPSGGKSAISVAISGLSVRVTVNAAYTSADTITIGYTPGANPIKGLSGLNAAALVARAVQNGIVPVDTTAPVYQTAVVQSAEPDVIVVTFGEALSPTLTGSATVGGPARMVVSSVVSGATVRVTVSSGYANADAPTITYPAGWARDAAGNQALAGTARPVTNNIPDTTAPVYASAAVADATPTKIVVTFDGPLSATLTGSATVGGPARTVSSSTVVGSTVEVVVNAAYVNGEAPTITYPAGWVRDAAGNQALAGTARPITNNVQVSTAPVTTFDSLYAGGWVPNSGSDAKTQPAQTMPAKTTNIMTGGYREPVYDTEMRIITAAVDVGTAGNDSAVHDYSSQQAFNANSTKFNIQSRNGFHYIFDAATNTKIDMGGVNPAGLGAIVGMAGNCEPQWHPTDSNILFYTANAGSMIRYQLDVAAKTSSTYKDFTALVRAQPGMSTAGKVWSVGEGRCSDDANRWGFLVTTSADATLGMVVYERSTDSILRSWTFTNTPNWVSISPSGLYLVASWYGTSAGSVYPAALDAETARPLNSKGGANVFRVSDGVNWAISLIGEHSDMAWDYQGKEVYLSVSFSPGDGFVYDGCVYTRRLEDPTVQTEYPIRTSGGATGLQVHLSGRAIRRKGWGLVNKSPGVGSGAWDGSVMAVELVPASLSPKIFRLFQHRAAGGDQFASPVATVNPDFTRVLAHTQVGGNNVDLCCLLPSWALPVAGARAPTAVTAPVMSGSATPGGTLTTTTGTYAGLPASTVTRVWQQSANGSTGWATIGGQTGTSYVVGVANGVYVSVLETATNGSSPDATQRSNVSVIAALAAPVNTVAPTSPTTGQTDTQITAVAGTWTGNPTPSIAFVWQRDTGGSTWVDSAFTTRAATLTPAGPWRPKETATNSQGTVTATGATVTISVPASEPVPSTIITFNQANNTTLETINAAFDGSTKYQVQSSTLQNMDATGGGSNLFYLTTSTGTNQAVQTTMVQPSDMADPSRVLELYLHYTPAQTGYVVQVGETLVRLYRIADATGPGANTPVSGPTAHAVNTATTNLTVKMTELNGRVRVYINGSGTALIDYTDGAKLTGGQTAGLVWSGATPSRIKLQDWRYGSS